MNRSGALVVGVIVAGVVSALWYSFAGLGDGEKTTFLMLLPLVLFDAGFVAWSLKVCDTIAENLFSTLTNTSWKDPVRSNWTNSGVISALIATIAAATWMVDVPDEESRQSIHNQLFSALAANALLFSIVGTLSSSISLAYTDGLDDASFKEFFQNFKGLVGLPLMFMVGSLMSLFISLAVRHHALYGRANTFVVGILTFGAFCALAYQWWTLWKYTAGVAKNKRVAVIQQPEPKSTPSETQGGNTLLTLAGVLATKVSNEEMVGSTASVGVRLSECNGMERASMKSEV